MRKRSYILLVLIILLALAAGWVDLPTNTGLHLGPINRNIQIHEGLDLQGGLQVVLQAAAPPGQTVSPDAMQAAQGIIENRINGLGVTEPVVQSLGNNRILVQLPGIGNADAAIQTLGSTGLLEFVDAGQTPLSEGETVQTTGPSSVVVPGAAASATPKPTPAPTATQTPGATPTEPTPIPPPPIVYRTVMTGKDLASASLALNSTNQPTVQFTLTPDGAKIFSDYTMSHVGQYLAIVLDKRVISSPVIQNPITNGQGVIVGNFTVQSAQQLVIQLKYGALPVPLQVVESEVIGPTLGSDSVHKSIVAGAVGLLIVASFMLLYYRLPGLLADLALTIYGLIVFAIYKFGIPGIFSSVTLTLPGIAGFILSVGMAVDANVLIFERMKEELRFGRTLVLAVESGFRRAWPSIRDANISTLITCGILLWFGASFGASIVAGFALTLAIGVLVSLFTAVVITHTFVRLIMDIDVTQRHWWFGV